MQIHQHEGSWYFWDETGAERLGPFSTAEDAEEAKGEYQRVVLMPELLAGSATEAGGRFAGLMGPGRPMPAPDAPGRLARAKAAFRSTISADWHAYKEIVRSRGDDYAPTHAMSLREAARRQLIPPQRGQSLLDLALAAAPTELEYQEQVQRTLAMSPDERNQSRDLLSPATKTLSDVEQISP